MALVLVQLKLAIQRRSLGHRGGPQRAFFVTGWVLAVVLGLAAGVFVERLASARDGLGDLGLLLVLTVVFLGWALTPILLPGLGDQTVDPARLESYPISAREQVSGLLLGALIAPTALLTFLASAGGTFASGEVVGARIAVLLSAVIFTVLCVVTSRSIQALLAGVVRSRRARDLMIGFSAALGLGIYLLSQAAHNLTNVLVDLENNTVEQVLAWLPPGAVGAGMLAVRDGRWGVAALHLLVAVATILIAAAMWMWAIRRRVKGSGRTTGGPRRKPSPARDLALLPLPLAALPATAIVGVAAQTLRYYFFRQPLATQSAVMAPILGVILAHTTIHDGDLTTAAVILAVLLVASVGFNVFGFDDHGFAYLVISGVALRSVLWGKVLTALLITTGALTVVLLAEAALNSAWGDVFPALLAGVSAAMAGAGVGAVVSVVAPRNRTRGGGVLAGGGATLAATLLGLVAVFALAGVLLVAFLAITGLPEPLIGAVAVAATAALCAGLVAWAARRAQRDLLRMQGTLVAA